MVHIADDYEALVDYLYEEGEPDARRRIEGHLAECRACADVALEMQSVRGRLSGWAPPVSRLGFRVVQEPPQRAGWMQIAARRPVWAQAAAAVVLFAAGMAVSQLDVQYAGGGLTVRPKSNTASNPQSPTPHPVLAHASGSDAEPGGVASSHSAAPTPLPSASNVAGDSQALLSRVQAMIDQSEERHRRELALRLAQVVRDVDAQRRADLLRVEQNFGQLEGQTGAEVAQQRELLNYLVKVSEQK